LKANPPNRHNRIYTRVEPLEPEIVELIRKGELFDEMDRKQGREDTP
jgi:elongation factor 2